jgi:hypothetical protein
MTGWTSDELTKIEAADELEIASLRRDGTLRHATTIWVVRLGDDPYVQSVNGRTAAWFRGACTSGTGTASLLVRVPTASGWARRGKQVFE